MLPEVEGGTRNLFTDGPMQTIGSSTIRKNYVQMELSAMRTQLDTTFAITGQNLIRLGISSWFEGRLMLQEGSQRRKFFDEAPQRIFPFSAGFKARLIKRGLKAPEIALLAHIQVPVNSHIKESSAYWSPMVKLCVDQRISTKLNLGLNAGFMQQAFSRKTSWIGSLMIRYQPNNKLNFFAEYFGRYPDKSLPVHAIDLGILYQNGKNYQVHFSIGTSVLRSPAIAFINAGFSFRLPE